MKKHITIILFVLSSIVGLAQNTPQNTQLKTEGTYQIQVINSRDQPYIPANIEEIIKNNRELNKTTYYKIADNVRIKILSETAISAKDFKPLEKIIHIEE